MKSYTIIVTDKKNGILIQQNYNTTRNIHKQTTISGKTFRETTKNNISYHDTSRMIHNFHNLEFDTSRHLNNNISNIYDTKRTVISDVAVNNHSLFIFNNDKSLIECATFKYTDLFPYPNKYITVQLDNKENRYIPLSDVGDDFDSGLRYTLTNGQTYQVCSNVVVNIINSYFLNNNFLVNAKNTNSVYDGLHNIFYSNVTKKDDCVYLKMPHKHCGITKVFIMGLYIEITNMDTGVTYNTYQNGLNKTSYGGDNKYKANAMLLKLQARHHYKIKVLNKYKRIQYSDTDIVQGMLIFGMDVENLEESSSSYQPLIDSESYCTNNNITILSQDNDYTKKHIEYAKEKWLQYPKSSYKYNYFVL